MKNYFIYIIECKNKSYYTGVTNNVEQRLNQHNLGQIPGCYTHDKRPLKLVYIEQYQNINQAINREKQIKGWSRKKKEALITANYSKLINLSKSTLRQAQGDNAAVNSSNCKDDKKL